MVFGSGIANFSFIRIFWRAEAEQYLSLIMFTSPMEIKTFARAALKFNREICILRYTKGILKAIWIIN